MTEKEQAEDKVIREKLNQIKLINENITEVELYLSLLESQRLISIAIGEKSIGWVDNPLEKKVKGVMILHYRQSREELIAKATELMK